MEAIRANSVGREDLVHDLPKKNYDEEAKRFITHYRAASPFRRFLVRVILTVCKIMMNASEKWKGETIVSKER